MKKYIGMLLVLLILTTSTAIATKDDNDDGIPKDSSWVDKQSPIITVDKERGISKAEFVLRDTDIEKIKQNSKNVPTQINPVFGSSGTCWSTFATWGTRLPVTYTINPTNPQGLSQSFVTSAISRSAETWDYATPKELFNNVYKIDYYAKYGKYDGKNSLVFGYYPYSGVLAVTGIWYYTSTGQIVETDMLFNTAYRWGDATINPSIMDLRNIATHELGHVVGMNDIYGSSCYYVTMYGYGSTGETKKRTLETPDITGLLTLYH